MNVTISDSNAVGRTNKTRSYIINFPYKMQRLNVSVIWIIYISLKKKDRFKKLRFLQLGSEIKNEVKKIECLLHISSYIHFTSYEGILNKIYLPSADAQYYRKKNENFNAFTNCSLYFPGRALWIPYFSHTKFRVLFSRVLFSENMTEKNNSDITITKRTKEPSCRS